MTRTMLLSSSIAPHRAGSPVILSLDYADARRALAFADKVAPQQCRLKIGKEMFSLARPALVRYLQQRGFDVFLDPEIPRYFQYGGQSGQRSGGAGGLDGGQRSRQRRQTHDGQRRGRR